MATKYSETPTWRPARGIRPLAIGLLQRDDRFLVTEVLDDSGVVKGWRTCSLGLLIFIRMDLPAISSKARNGR